jgi:CDP-paratose 2-epimerase
MRILITGGAGFVGSSLALYFARKYPSYSITAFDNLKRRGSELNLSSLRDAGVGFVHGDIRNAEDISACEHFDVLIEASAEPSVLAGLNSDPSYVINNNLYGSVNCFNACLKNKAALIFLSTSRVYPIERIEKAEFVEEGTRFAFAPAQRERGISANGISEDLDINGARSFYGTTKLASELLIAEYTEFYKLKAAVTRFGVIAGPRQMGKTDQGVATLWMAKHFWKQSLKYIGYGGLGKQVRDLLHIDDLLRLVDMQVHDPAKFSGRVYNAGGGLSCSASLQEMSTICSEITGNKIKIDSDPVNRPADLRIYISDNTRILSETGWKPEKDAKAIFADIYNWIRQNESQLKPILG